ncbi:hypothetical protein [Caldalkalibacillus mannanilyticus]|uniref:hypothetical protein n=1 Tax=Caldalkalibacillus mannanilyticus TaxID=1418 RepID=UPI00046862CF|nr:hypothetical protein [Caldalkalibacillus mannanilyticus]
MIITCDAYSHMGYIYLKPPIEGMEYFLSKENHLYEYIGKEDINIPVLDGKNMMSKLDLLSIQPKTYAEALGNEEIDEEYCNDRDSEGYLIGIEMSLSKEQFLSSIHSEAFKCYSIEWRGQECKLYTMDRDEEVFQSGNKVYPLTLRNDAFVIVQVVEKYGNLGLIKGLITHREDIYPVEYMTDPQFILSEYD